MSWTPSSSELSATPLLADGALPFQPVAFALAAGSGVGLVLVAAANGARLGALGAIGLLLGATLYFSSFGFASAYRRLFEGRGTAPVQAHCVLLALATLLFALILSQEVWFGREITGAIAPAGIPVAVGAFLFGVGMQLAGACGSGCLYVAGGGQLRMLLVLVAFCAGSFRASLDMDFWARLPAAEPAALGQLIGWPTAVFAQLALLGAIYFWLGRLPQNEAVPTPVASTRSVPDRLWRGPWSLMAGAAVLAGLNALTLIVSGHPWSITWAFTLWAAKAARFLGWDPQASAFWNADFQAAALQASVFSDETSVMDFGMLIGAFAAACTAGEFRTRLGPSRRAVAAAVLGGLVMGYGARIAFGCNVGAFFSGIASTSLHGWLWILAALPGCWVGLKVRSVLGGD